jgi:1,4-dihydroxy-2-naphthoate octaprenyltransferase
MRILMVISILITCICYPDVRIAFGESAIGHISYMMVRLGPVYKTGSMYLNKEEKIKWDNSTEKEKMYDLLTGKYLMFSIEVFLLIVTSIIFAVLRISILLSENHMIFEHDHANTPLFNPHMGL